MLPYAIGRSAAGRTFYVTREPSQSSLLEPNPQRVTPSWEVVATPKIDTHALDDLYARGELTGVYDFIKLDTQGSELEILQASAERVLPNTLGVETEAEFFDLYRDQPLFSEVELYLRAWGFELVLLKERFSQREQHEMDATRRRLTYCDAVFLRGSAWLAQLDDAPRQKSLKRLVALYLTYGLCAEALTLALPYDAQLAQFVREYHAAAADYGWRWRLGLLRAALACALSPSRRQRIRLARRILTIDSPDGGRWSLLDVHNTL